MRDERGQQSMLVAGLSVCEPAAGRQSTGSLLSPWLRYGEEEMACRGM
jgi:hypothetical protein